MPTNRKLFVLALTLGLALVVMRAFDLHLPVKEWAQLLRQAWSDFSGNALVEAAIALVARAWAGWASIDWEDWAPFLAIAAIGAGLLWVIAWAHGQCTPTSEPLWIGGVDGHIQRFSAVPDVICARTPQRQDADDDEREDDVKWDDNNPNFRHGCYYYDDDMLYLAGLNKGWFPEVTSDDHSFSYDHPFSDDHSF